MSGSLLGRFFRRTPPTALPTPPAPEQLEAKAHQGDAEAQFNLGLKYANGEGTPVDYNEAARWYAKAADQSHALAQFNLGIMCARGQGMPADQAQSNHWIEKAACLGDPGAQYSLGIALYRASLSKLPEPANACETRIEAYKWLQLAGAQGYRDSASLWPLATVKMTNEDVADGNRRVASFLAAKQK